MAHVATRSLSDSGFSKLLLDELNRSQICDLQNQAEEVGGFSSMEWKNLLKTFPREP